MACLPPPSAANCLSWAIACRVNSMRWSMVPLPSPFSFITVVI
jgi:hypothetical protein